jgi:hypothetical protein
MDYEYPHGDQDIDVKSNIFPVESCATKRIGG